MIVIPQTVKVKWSHKYKQRYLDLGYKFTEYGDGFDCDVRDLAPMTNVKIRIICDYCGQEFERIISDHTKSKRNNPDVTKDCCLLKSCKMEKRVETNKIRFGVENYTQLPEMRQFRSEQNAKYDIDSAKKIFLEHGWKLLDSFYLRSDKPMKVQCIKHPEVITYRILESTRKRKSEGCNKCISETYRGPYNSSWKYGVTKIKTNMRGYITEWKKRSAEACSYKCVITGDVFDDIHHLYSFSNILQECIEELGLNSYENIGDYTEEQLKAISSLLQEKHEIYPLGVCLRRDVHELFHSIYGKTNNTSEQFYEFKSLFKNGEIQLQKEVV